MSTTPRVLTLLSDPALREEIDRVTAAVGTTAVHLDAGSRPGARIWAAARAVVVDGAGYLTDGEKVAVWGDVRARIQSVERLDQAAEKVQKSMQIFLRDPAPLDHITRRLEPKGDGDDQRRQNGAERDALACDLRGRCDDRLATAGAKPEREHRQKRRPGDRASASGGASPRYARSPGGRARG